MPDLLRMAPAYTPTREELVTGYLMTEGRATARAADLLPTSPTGTPRAVLERTLRARLATGPCFVLFSGGRDSSLVLAVAAAVARRDGLPLPIPITHRYPGDALIDERDWQDRVIAHLQLDEWVVVDATGRHELLGAVARDALRRHGPQLPSLWWTTRLPPEAGGEAVAGGEPIDRPSLRGTLLTGAGGDDLFPDSPRLRIDRLRAGNLRALRRPRTLLSEARTIRQPIARRAAKIANELERDLTWVRPPHRSRLAISVAAGLADYPLRYDRFLARLHADRALQGGRDRNRLAAAESGVTLTEPLLDPDFLASLAGHFGTRFPASRTHALAWMAGDLLPPELIRRTSKAYGDSAFLGEESVQWLQAWDGTGPDEDLVDGDEIRRRLLLMAGGGEGGDGRCVGAAQRALAAQLGAVA